MKEKHRIAFFEEWPSLRSNKIMPLLSSQFDIIYVAGNKGSFPEGDFREVITFPAPRFIFQHGPAFSRLAGQLYRDRRIEFAVHYAGIAFLARSVPMINFLGGSYRVDFSLNWQEASLRQRLRLPIGYLHYSVPEKMSCRRAAMHIVNSHALKNSLVSLYHLDPAEISVVHNGVDVDFQNLGERKKNLHGRIKILFVGRLHPRKGILALAEEFSAIGDIDADLLIAGDGPDAGMLQEICKNDSRIQLLGSISKERLLQVMEETSIFVFPSYHEGCPNALLEAMAARHHCLCYDIPPVHEVLGGTGMLVPCGDAGKLCRLLRDAVARPEMVRDSAEHSFQRAHSFSWTSCAEEVAAELSRFADQINR